MQIKTIDENFDYQVDEIFKKIYEDYKEQIKESNLSFSDWLWANPNELGKAFFERVDEYQGIDETIELLELGN